jgi:hypothetical protein
MTTMSSTMRGVGMRSAGSSTRNSTRPAQADQHHAQPQQRGLVQAAGHICRAARRKQRGQRVQQQPQAEQQQRVLQRLASGGQPTVEHHRQHEDGGQQVGGFVAPQRGEQFAHRVGKPNRRGTGHLASDARAAVVLLALPIWHAAGVWALIQVRAGQWHSGGSAFSDRPGGPVNTRPAPETSRNQVSPGLPRAGLKRGARAASKRSGANGLMITASMPHDRHRSVTPRVALAVRATTSAGCQP